MAIRDSVDVSEDRPAQQESLRAILTDQLSSAELRSALDGEPGYHPELHARLAAELGLAGWTIRTTGGRWGFLFAFGTVLVWALLGPYCNY